MHKYTTKELAKLFDEVIEDVEHWGSYAPDFFKEKYNLQGCIDKYNKIKEEFNMSTQTEYEDEWLHRLSKQMEEQDELEQKEEQEEDE